MATVGQRNWDKTRLCLVAIDRSLINVLEAWLHAPPTDLRAFDALCEARRLIAETLAENPDDN